MDAIGRAEGEFAQRGEARERRNIGGFETGGQRNRLERRHEAERGDVAYGGIAEGTHGLLHREVFDGLAQRILEVMRIVGGVQLAFADARKAIVDRFAAMDSAFPLPSIHALLDEQFDRVALFDGAGIIERPADECFGVHDAFPIASNRPQGNPPLARFILHDGRIFQVPSSKFSPPQASWPRSGSRLVHHHAPRPQTPCSPQLTSPRANRIFGPVKSTPSRSPRIALLPAVALALSLHAPLHAQEKPAPTAHMQLRAADALRITGAAAEANARADAFSKQGSYAEAEKEYREAARLLDTAFRPAFPDLLKARSNLARVLHAQGKHAEAEKEYRTLLAIRRQEHPAGNATVFAALLDLARCLSDQGRWKEALDIIEPAETEFVKLWGAENPLSKQSKAAREQIQAKLKTQPSPEPAK